MLTKKKLKKALSNSEGVFVRSNQPQNNSAKQNNPDASKEVSRSKNLLQNAAYARPESQNIKLDVFSVMRKSEKRNRQVRRNVTKAKVEPREICSQCEAT